MFRNLFFGSMRGMLAFFAIELGILLYAWGGKTGSDWMIVAALGIHLVFSFAVFLNLAPLLGATIMGYVGGIAPQTAAEGGQEASSAVKLYIKASMGISYSVTLMMMSLFILDYQFSFVWFFLMMLIVMAWGQHVLVFPTEPVWARRVSTSIMVVVTLMVAGVSLSSSVSYFLTGRVFTSEAAYAYKQAVIMQLEQEGNKSKARAEACQRVRNAIEEYGAVQTKEIDSQTSVDDLVRDGRIQKSDMDLCQKQLDDNKNWNVPALTQKGIGAAQGVSKAEWIKFATIAVVGILVLIILFSRNKRAWGWMLLIALVLGLGGVWAHENNGKILGLHISVLDPREPFEVVWKVSLDSKPIQLPKDARGPYRAEYPKLSIAYNCLDQWGQFNLHGSKGKMREGELVFNGYQRDGVEFYGKTVQIYPNLGPQACNYKEGEVRLITNPTPTVTITFKPI